MNRALKSRYSGHILSSMLLALVAGVLGSLVTLLLTGNLGISAEQQADDMEIVDSLAENESLLVDLPSEGFVGSVGAVENLSAGDIDSYAEFTGALGEAAEERAQLAQVLAQLTRQIESLESDFINQQSMQALTGATQTGIEQTGMPEGQTAGFGNTGNPGQAINAQDRIETLVSVGIDLQSAQAMQARQNQYQLARLELFDQAQREGWIDSEQFSDRLTELNEQRPDLREELGDDAYDRYLFEAGQSNRVIVASIIPGSQADIAGLQPGDMVMSYAGSRVFSTRDLQRATREGVRGEQVPMSVNRQGQPLFFDLQRGPLGVTLSQDLQNPS